MVVEVKGTDSCKEAGKDKYNGENGENQEQYFGIPIGRKKGLECFWMDKNRNPA